MNNELVRSTAAPPSNGQAAPRLLHGRVLVLARLAWWLLFLVVIAMVLLAIPVNLAFLREVCVGELCGPERITPVEMSALTALGLSADAYASIIIGIELLPPLVYLSVAFLLFLRKPDDRMVYFTSVTLILFGGVTYPEFVQHLAVAQPVWVVPFVLFKYLGSVFLVTFFYIFPSGTFVPRWIRFILLFWIVEEAIDAVSSPPLNLGLEPHWLANSGFALILLTALLSQVYRYRRVSGAMERQQTKWVVFGITIALTVLLLLALVASTGFSTQGQVLLYLLLITLLVLAVTAIPVSIGIAILRSHLYDIDLLINRTLVYGALTPILAGVFAATSSLVQKFFVSATGQQSGIASTAATLVVVASFVPVRKRVEKFVDARFKYPTRHFGELGSKLREHVELTDPHALLKKFLREALHTLSAPCGAVYLGQGESAELVQQVGRPPAAGDLSVPLEYEGKQYALLILGARDNGHPYNKQERESLEQLGHLVAQAIQIANRRDPSLGSGQAPDPSLRSGQAPEI